MTPLEFREALTEFEGAAYNAQEFPFPGEGGGEDEHRRQRARLLTNYRRLYMQGVEE